MGIFFNFFKLYLFKLNYFVNILFDILVELEVLNLIRIIGKFNFRLG